MENSSHHHNKLLSRLPHVWSDGKNNMSGTVNTLSGAQESMPAIAAKAGPSVSVSLATIAGYNVSDIILWATLIYTVLMIAHKVYHIWRDIKGHKKNGSD